MYSSASLSASLACSVQITRRRQAAILAELALDFFVRDRAAGLHIGSSALDGLQHVEMVENVVRLTP